VERDDMIVELAPPASLDLGIDEPGGHAAAEQLLPCCHAIERHPAIVPTFEESRRSLSTGASCQRLNDL